MTKEHAIRHFVTKYFRLLKSNEAFDGKKYDQIKKAYFGTDLRFKFGNPPDKEIGDCFIKILIRANRITDVEMLTDIIETTPFLRPLKVDPERYGGEVTTVSDKYSISEELSGLRDVEKIERLAERAKEQKTKEIEELILQKKEEYRKLPSILDDTEFEEPEEPASTDQELEWWEELKLRDNPFPGPLEGFSVLDKSLYNDIIVETPPISWALKKLQSDPVDLFHKGYLLAGEFGTGKTTFFDFISLHLLAKHIEPIRIAIVDQVSEAHYLQKFDRELAREISRVARKHALPTTSRIIDIDEAMYLMLEIQAKGIKGFCVFLDDLHKNTDRNRVFNFLGQLQITKNNFYRDQINIFYIVSGFTGWKDRIKQDSALTGFFDAAENLTLPEVTPVMAAQAITKRLKAFATNPEKELSVQEDFLRTIFKRVSAEVGHTNIGFRPYIREAVNHFAEHRFDILSIDFTRLDEITSNSIRRVLEANADFKYAISKLIYGGGIKKREIRELTLKVLCQIYLMRGVAEDEDLFQSNKFAFKKLHESGFIQKYSRKEEVIWNLSPYLRDLNSQIIAEFNLSIEDYLVPIYALPSQRAAEVEKPERTRLELYSQDVSNWRGVLEPHIISNLAEALGLYTDNISPFTQGDPKRIHSINLPGVDAVRKCVWSLMKSIIRLESPLLLDICGEEEILGWTLRHGTLEYSSHFIQMEREMRASFPGRSDVIRLISFANDAFDELWREFTKALTLLRYSHTKCYELPRQMLKVMFTEYENLFSNTLATEEYFNSLDKFVSVTEDLLRQYLLISCALVLGPYHERIKHYPEEIRKYIVKNTATAATSYESLNEFENLNRGQYRFLFTQVKRSDNFYRLIAGPVIRGWDSTDIEAFFDLFGDLNIIAGHRKFFALDERRKDIPTFFRLASRFVSCMSGRLKDLVVKDNCIHSISASDSVVMFGCGSAGFKNEGDTPSIFYRHKTNEVMHEQLGRNVSISDNAFGYAEIDLLDIEGIRIKFGGSFSDSVACLAYSLAKEKIRLMTLYGTDVSVATNSTSSRVGPL